MQNLSNEVEIIQGSDRPLEIQLMEEDCGSLKVFSLANMTEIKAIFKNADGSKLEKLQTSGGITVVSSPDGEIQIKFEQAETSLLKIGKCQSFEIEVTKSLDAGATTDTYIWQFENVLTVKGRLL